MHDAPRMPAKKTRKAAKETVKTRQARALAVLEVLLETWPDAHCELDFEDPFQLLVAVVLSAQCTDVNVNKATPALFARYPTPAAMANATPEEIEPLIRTLGLFRNKAKNLVLLAKALVEKHGGKVPNTHEALFALAGVGRKTANVVLANAFGVPALAVDTHVGRLARRLGLTQHDNPDEVEKDLCALWPREQWVPAHHALIFHGRRVCGARQPDCAHCSLNPLCPSALRDLE